VARYATRWRSQPAFTQDATENRALQFETPQEIVARAAIADMIARQCGRVYAAPVYNTVISRQYNCSVGATATGNQSAQRAIANSPTVTGAAAPSTGNADQRGGERCQPRRHNRLAQFGAGWLNRDRRAQCSRQRLGLAGVKLQPGQ
jgi:hypothetical protein